MRVSRAPALLVKIASDFVIQILDEIEEHNIKIYHLPDAESDEDEDFKEQTRLLKVRIPGAQHD